MITDKQGREWVLQKLYDDGWRYMIGGDGIFIYLTKNKPLIVDGMYKCTGDEYTLIGRTNCILPDLGKGEVMSIAEELGIVDWSKVPVDTPVLVRSCKESEWRKRYFAFYKAGKVHTWDSGATSWSKERIENTSWWNYVKLAEV
jgi:hypothetical protein